MKKYKTPEKWRLRAKEARDAIKAAGGAEYEALLLRERAAIKARREKNGRQSYDKSNRKTYPFRTWMCANARHRGRKRGLDATIMPEDLHWPTHCPVLGIELEYPARSGDRKDRRVQDNWPSLDRWDNTKGYIPGNVFVISFRANTLKNTGNIEEVMKVLAYLREPPCGALSEPCSQITS